MRCRINLRRVLSPNSPIPVLATRARVTALGSAPGGAAPFGATRDRLILQPALSLALADTPVGPLGYDRPRDVARRQLSGTTLS